MSQPATGRGLTIVACGAGPARDLCWIVELAQSRGWSVDVVATPAAVPFLDATKVEELTGTPIRSEYRDPAQSQVRVLSSVEAMIVAPATYNTICKLALGISDNYALGSVAEAIGRQIPVVIAPFVNSALAGRAPFAGAVRSLRAEGVRVLLGSGQWTPHPPGTGGAHQSAFPWSSALDEADLSARRV